jgi:uncharacterized membrane protein YkvA (DUF1232 family)
MRLLLISLGVAFAAWVVLVLVLVVAGRREAAREMASFLPNLVRLFRGLLKDGRVPRSSKVLLLFGLVWFSSPIDLIPEFVPIAGPLDDAIVAALILRRVLRTAGREVVHEHWRGDPRSLDKMLRLFTVR